MTGVCWHSVSGYRIVPIKVASQAYSLRLSLDLFPKDRRFLFCLRKNFAEKMSSKCQKNNPVQNLYERRRTAHRMKQRPCRYKNKPAPLLNPGTLEPMKAEERENVFCSELVKQELNNTDRYIEIPQTIRDFYKMYRPSLLSGPTAWKKSSARRRKSIISSRATIPAEAIN